MFVQFTQPPQRAQLRALYFTHKHNFLLYAAAMDGQQNLAVQTGLQLFSEVDIPWAAQVSVGQQAHMPNLLQVYIRCVGPCRDVLLRSLPS